MVKTIVMFVILILFCTTFLIAQELTEQEKQKIIFNLRNANLHNDDQAYNAILKVLKYDIEEAIPEIENNFNIQNNYSKELFLEALNKFHSPNVIFYANSFLDSLNTEVEEDRWFIFSALTIIFDNGDFTKYQLALDELGRVNPMFDSYLVDVLKSILFNMPEHSNIVETGLKRATIEASNHLTRWDALKILDEKFGENNIPFLIQTASNETEFSSRIDIIKYLFSKYKSPLISTYIKQEAIQEAVTDTNYFIKGELLNVLAKNFGTIENYIFINDLYNSNPESFDNYIIEHKSFYNRKPDSSIATSTLLDTLTSYTNQSYGYEWLKDESYKTELLTKLTNAKTKLTTGDSLGCRTEIASFQNSVNQVYQDSAGSYPNM